MSAKLRRRIVAGLAVFVAAVCVGAALGAGGNDDQGKYLVRAVFDNASFVIPGEDVKVAGVVVGSIDSLSVDDHNRAVVVLRIDDPAFKPFHKDATCRIGLQSLIGEQFVECDPTQVRGGDQAPAPTLPAIKRGQPGAGQHLVPVSQTETPVGVDLLNDIMRVPQQQRLPLIINELGAGLSGNGQALNAAIKRASPVLKQADQLVATLASQNKMLGRLVDQSDAILAPMAKRRKDIGAFVKQAGGAATATAKQGDALEASFARFPAFLKQLGPAVDRLGAFADQATPAIQNLSSEAASVNASVARLGPLAQKALPTFKSLGKVADEGRTVFPKLKPHADQINALATALQPAARDLAALSTSFDNSGGIEALLRLFYFYTGAVNGEDASGHYTRASVVVNPCIDRYAGPKSGSLCQAEFVKSTDAASSDTSTARANASSTLLGYLLGDGKK
ncbi:MAG TPA: MlaD family protein [Baekduia sp.]|uniref:MlaD family protein n=1 Tax=Baekduia sp. TaxID=2600305 RepID=UPI002D7A01D5|nr:MlaD family protein [Baekduia sp.]HET6509314.1 MlaD family protein [Baekduia sp.]